MGVRLAVGGSRKSWTRLALQGFGIGLCVAMLLLAASLPTALDARADRVRALGTVARGDGPPPLLAEDHSHAFRSDSIRGFYLKVLSPDAPVPPGVDRLPGDGEVFLSPALADLLASPAGELLRPRFPERVVGTIGQPGLENPRELRFYAGDASIEAEPNGNTVYRWGATGRSGAMDPVLWLLSLVGVVVLLFPVLVFIGVATRLAAAQRDRRLAALRLVGAGAGRVRLIASGESLIGALAGLVVGFGLFFAVRPFVDRISIAELSSFPSDVTPTPALTLTVVVAVPVLAVVTSLVAMRRTIIEPLGVVREQNPVRRRVWWRLVPVVAGAGLLVSQIGHSGERTQLDTTAFVAGVVLLMLGIPVLLPWLVERVVFRMRGHTPALQLAVRRLQLDSGTAARVVGGVAVVLAGTVTLQMLLAGIEKEVRADEREEVSHQFLTISGDSTTDLSGLPALMGNTRGVLSLHRLDQTSAEVDDRTYISVNMGSCEALRSLVTVPDCADGKAYVVARAGSRESVRAGQVLKVGVTGPDTGTPWTVPPVEPATGTRPGLFLTPAAAAGLRSQHSDYQAELDPSIPDVAEHTRNALASHGHRVHTYYVGQDNTSEVEHVFGVIRRALLAGSLLTLLLAGASLLVVGLEQVRERRRPLAVMTASGVPRGTLARSLLWQNAVPLVISTAVSVATGVGLGVLVMRVFDTEVAFDWAGIGLVAGLAVALTFAVTVLTLPSLWKATGALGLRTE
ncbi:hypothetical protein ADL03_30995 [Nocardia sp. NRRL S-836]|nr:hypothetical protein ADL03_30995 [Nocardia sp. NRRL S-836]